jgi:hypothetical protein
MDTKELAKLLGSIGGKATSRLYGKEHYSKAGKKGMEVRWHNKRLLSITQEPIDREPMSELKRILELRRKRRNVPQEAF